jgi:multicomponent Na+:H+ antiporter subunit C
MTAAVAVGILVAGGTYLVLQPELLRVVLGFVLLGHGVNVLIVAAGGMDRRGVPLIGQEDAAVMADPLPQAFVLTAIVITFAITVYLLGLLKAGADDERVSTDPDGDAGEGAPPGADPEAHR